MTPSEIKISVKHLLPYKLIFYHLYFLPIMKVDILQFKCFHIIILLKVITEQHIRAGWGYIDILYLFNTWHIKQYKVALTFLYLFSKWHFKQGYVYLFDNWHYIRWFWFVLAKLSWVEFLCMSRYLENW